MSGPDISLSTSEPFPGGAPAPWDDAQEVAALLAIDPAGLGGVCVRAAPGPVRDWWTEQFLSLLPQAAPKRKLPLSAGPERILGGLDLASTLRAGRPVAERGLLAEADGGVLIAAMAERMPPATAALIAAAMDHASVRIERDGVSRADAARFACVLYDEGADMDETPPQILMERVAFYIDLNSVSVRAPAAGDPLPDNLDAARAALRDVAIPEDIERAIAEAGLALGAYSMRAMLFCFSAARCCAALHGRGEVNAEDAQTACRLVLGPRCAPFVAAPEQAAESPPPPDSGDQTDSDKESESVDTDDLKDVLVNVVRGAALNAALGRSAQTVRRKVAAGAGGKSGALIDSLSKGRPIGAKPGGPRDGGRLDVISTLRSAAPWRKVRARGGDESQIRIYPEDLRIKRFKARTETVVIFVVDASGSSAMNRMAEAKGAVELLLADCYTRRDHIALIAFRGAEAELLLPPTRSLVRVRRALAHLPGGGGTPLATGIATAAALAEKEKRKGKTPFVVFLSDGRGNIGRNGEPGREQAEADALAAARGLRTLECTTLFFDISQRPSPRAQNLSAEMGALYQPLPYADSATVSKRVKEVMSTA
ncbi:MAG: magnesium chelatase subunit D [Hyphococcus sp.]